MYVKSELKEHENFSLINFIANEYSKTQNMITKTLRSTVSMIKCKKGGLIRSTPAILSSIDLTIEEPIVLLPAVSMLTKTLGSRNRDVLNPVTIISTKMTGRAAIRIWTKGVFQDVFEVFSNRLSLQVRIPNTNIRKNRKKRWSIILKVLEIEKNPKYTIKEESKRRFVVFEYIMING